MHNEDRVTPLVYKFSDHERVLEILSTRSRRYVSKFNKFMLNIENHSYFNARQFAGVNANNKRPGETILRLLDLSKNVTQKGVTSHSFPIACRRILDADSIDDFEKLHKDVQHQVWWTYYSNQSFPFAARCADRAYLRLLLMTGMSVVEAGPFGTDANDYMLTARIERDEKSRNNRVSAIQLDLSNPSADFVSYATDMIYDEKHIDIPSAQGRSSVIGVRPYDLQIPLMLRAIHGEEKIKTVLNSFHSERQIICANELITLLDEWDDLKQYPPTWIRQIKNLKH